MVIRITEEAWARTKEAYQSGGNVSGRQANRCVKSIGEENERVKKFGFTQGELDRAKADFMASIEKMYNDRDKTNSDSFVNEYQSHLWKRTVRELFGRMKLLKKYCLWCN